MYINFPIPMFWTINRDKVLKLIPGIVIIGLAIGGILGGVIAASYYVHSGSSGGGTPPGAGSERNANNSTIIHDPDELPPNLDPDKVNQEAYKEIAEKTAMLRSDLVEYDFKESGSTGDIWARVYAPGKIYGFSAFPVQVKLFTRKSPIEFNVVHIISVRVYLKDKNGNVKWTRTWDYGNGSEGLNGDSAVFTTILKVPDPFEYVLRNAVSSNSISKELISQIFNASTQEWEIFVDVTAKREKWQSYPNATDASSCEKAGGKWSYKDNTCYVFDRMVDLNYHLETTSAWKHVTRARDVGITDDGFYASLPVKFIASEYSSKYVIYQEKFAGALSNILIVSYATPVHVLNSTADYKFFIALNKGYFKPLSPTISDDFLFATVRVLKGGSWEVADKVSGKLGTMSEDHPVDKELSAKYTAAPNVLTYRSIGIAYFELKRDDNITIPLWIIAEPQISVVQNIRAVLADKQLEEIAKLTNDGKLSKEDIKKIRAQAQAWIGGLEEKIKNAEALKAKAEGIHNEEAAEYASNAISAYKDAIDALKKVQESDDIQSLLNWLNIAKKYEQAGDFYVNAAEKALFGDPEQAKLDAKKAKELIDLANQYKPRLPFLPEDLSNKSFAGLKFVDILVIIIGLAISWIGYKLIGPLGAIFGIVIIAGWFIGAQIGKLKFW